MSTVDDLAAMQGSDPIGAAEQLNALLSLPTSAAVRGARITGHGSRATFEIDLANDDTMLFDSVRDMTRPANLIAEVAAVAGVAITLKQPQAVQAVVLARALAERTQGTTENDAAIDWGISYLQAATVLDVDMEDQREKWAAFNRLKEAQAAVELAEAPGRQSALASSTVVLRSQSGVRYIRAGWFQRYVTRQDSTISRQAVTVRMLRVGWEVRGKSGRIKATCPGRPEALGWAFLMAPEGWENTQ